MPRLTDAEKQEVLRFLEADKPLPDKYRFLLFDDKREVELVWNGKTAEVCNIVLPFQTIEHVDEPRAETDKKQSDPQPLPARVHELLAGVRHAARTIVPASSPRSLLPRRPWPRRIGYDRNRNLQQILNVQSLLYCADAMNLDQVDKERRTDQCRNKTRPEHAGGSPHLVFRACDCIAWYVGNDAQ